MHWRQKVENMPLQTSSVFSHPFSSKILCVVYILIGNRVRVKSSGLAPGLANARPPGSARFANAPPPGMTRRANGPAVAVGEGVWRSWNWLIDWCIKISEILGLNAGTKKRVYVRTPAPVCTCIPGFHMTSQPRPPRALFPGFGGGAPKPGKSSLGTRLMGSSKFKELSILLSYCFHEVLCIRAQLELTDALQQLNTFIYTNLRFERVLRCAIKGAFAWRGF